MSTIVTPAGAPQTDADLRTAAAAKPLSPNQRAWARFRRNRIGLVSLWIFLAILVTATFAEIVSNDRPFVARIDGQWHAPMFANPSERAIGGDFGTGTDWKDPFVADVLARPGNWALFTLNVHSATSTDYFSPEVSPSPPTASNWIGTDQHGRDMVARLLYGFRVSIWFALALTVVGTLIGILAGALQGYFGGRVDGDPWPALDHRRADGPWLAPPVDRLDARALGPHGRERGARGLVARGCGQRVRRGGGDRDRRDRRPARRARPRARRRRRGARRARAPAGPLPRRRDRGPPRRLVPPHRPEAAVRPVPDPALRARRRARRGRRRPLRRRPPRRPPHPRPHGGLGLPRLARGRRHLLGRHAVPGAGGGGWTSPAAIPTRWSTRSAAWRRCPTPCASCRDTGSRRRSRPSGRGSRSWHARAACRSDGPCGDGYAGGAGGAGGAGLR